MKLQKLPDGTKIHSMRKMDTDMLYQEIFDDEVYRCNGLVEYHDGDVILDVGGNIGMYVLFVQRNCADAVIHSFEPIPAIYETLEANTTLHKNGCDVHLHNVGLSNRTEEVEFAYRPRFPCSSTMYPELSDDKAVAVPFILTQFDTLPDRKLRFALKLLPKFARRWLAGAVFRYYGKIEKVKCKLKGISEFIDEQKLQHIDLMKLDAEYAEIDILNGLRDEHWDIIKQMIVDVHGGQEEIDKVVGILEAHGFKPQAMDNDMHPYGDHFFYATR